MGTGARRNSHSAAAAPVKRAKAATLTHRFHDAQLCAGLTPVRFHDLRHAAATLMLGSGVDLKVVSELLGHSKIRTHGRRLHEGAR